MDKVKRKAVKKIKIGKNISVKPGVEAKLKERKGSSNVGKYKTVKKKDFAGTKGGAAPGSFPINTRKRARAALAYAHNAPNPAGIRAAVHKKYPSLGVKSKKKGK
jgi:hypothetical protein